MLEQVLEQNASNAEAKSNQSQIQRQILVVASNPSVQLVTRGTATFGIESTT